MVWHTSSGFGFQTYNSHSNVRATLCFLMSHWVSNLLGADWEMVDRLQTEALQSIYEGLQQILQSPLLSATCGDFGKMEIDEESQSPPCIRVQFSITVWDFILPITPSLPAVVGVSSHMPSERKCPVFWYFV